MSRPKPLIIDMSEHQLPSAINYDQLAASIDLGIIRVQYGSLYQDRYFDQHLSELKKRRVPVHVYAWVRGISYQDMKKEGADFYQRASPYKPAFWWLDVEERSMADMVGGSESFRQQLKELGAGKVGIYTANHLYHPFGFTQQATQKYDALWLPAYGQNTGQYNGANPTAVNEYDFHQYTSNGRLTGYAGPLDLSRLASKKSFGFFTGTSVTVTSPPYKLGDQVMIEGVYESSDSWVRLKPFRNTGKITAIRQGAKNPFLLDNGNLGWVNEEVIVKRIAQEENVYRVKQGDTLWGIAQGLGIRWQSLAARNQLADTNLIFPGQELYYK